MADRLSIKWVEGNTNGTTAEIAADTTYNVDQPAFWTPLSVLSGLASGYCERRAVLDPGFVTAAGTTVTWDQEGTGDTDSANRDLIVSNCMHNMALGSDTAHLFYNADATMYPIGAAAVSNYMTTMDAAINDLIDPTSANHYVAADVAGGTDYAGFSEVANYAVASANAAGSAIQTPEEGGGTTLKTVMAPGLPVKWAQQRKWMLDELRWTESLAPGKIDTVKYNGLQLNEIGSFDSVEAAVAQAISDGTAITGATVDGTIGFVDVIMSHGMLARRTLNPSNWGTTAQTTATTATVEYPGTTVTLRSDTDVRTVADNYMVSLYEDSTNVYDTRLIDTFNVVDTTVNSIQIEGSELSGKSVTVSMFLCEPQSIYERTNVFLSSYINPKSILVSGATTYTAANLPGVDTQGISGTLVVLDGGTANITGGSVYAALVEPHGSMLIGAGATVTNCCILTAIEDDTTVSGYVTGLYRPNTPAFDAVENLYQDFIPIRTDDTVTETDGSGTVIAADTTYSPEADVKRIFIAAGATCTLVSEEDYPCEFTVAPGGMLVMPQSCSISACVLLPGYAVTEQTSVGARLLATGNNLTVNRTLYVHSGGTCTFIPADSDESKIKYATIHSGGTCTINNNQNTLFAWGGGDNFGYLRVTEGAVLRVANTTTYSTDDALDATIINTPKDILEYRAPRGRSVVDESEVKRFYTHGLQLTGTTTAVTSGWNVADIVIPSGQTYGIVASTVGPAPDITPISAPMFIGHNGGDYSTTLLAGFQLATIKVTGKGVDDHYGTFYVRQKALPGDPGYVAPTP